MRKYAEIIVDVCKDKGLEARLFEDEYLIEIDKKYYIIGTTFPINNYAASKICNDKTAASHILKANGIDCIEHTLICRQDKNKFNFIQGRFVIKPNEGSEGRQVYIVRNKTEFESALKKVFKEYRTACISKFYKFDKEIRCFILNDELMYAYYKIRPSIECDGKHSVFELTNGKFISDQVPARDEHILLNWKHNLFGGAKPQLIEEKDITDELRDIAIKSAKTLGVKFATVDLACIGKGYKVVEVNSSVCATRFSEVYYREAKDIFSRAIDYMIKES